MKFTTTEPTAPESAIPKSTPPESQATPESTTPESTTPESTTDKTLEITVPDFEITTGSNLEAAKSTPRSNEDEQSIAAAAIAGVLVLGLVALSTIILIIFLWRFESMQ